MARLGIDTIGELAAMSAVEVSSVLGATIGPALHRLAQGVDDRQVAERASAKQISSETTLAQDIVDLPTLRRELLAGEAGDEAPAADFPARLEAAQHAHEVAPRRQPVRFAGEQAPAEHAIAAQQHARDVLVVFVDCFRIERTRRGRQCRGGAARQQAGGQAACCPRRGGVHVRRRLLAPL